jgi:chromosome segregation ATPase
MLWIRIAIVGVIVAALSAAAFKVTSWLNEKDRMVQERDQQILDLNAQVTGLRLDKERLTQSNASLTADLDKKRDELARAQMEVSVLHTTDAASDKRLVELERKLNDRERLEQMDRLRKSRRADLVLHVVNKSAKCELENFFQTGGTCKNGEWVKDGDRLAQPTSAQPTAGQPPVAAKPVGESHEPR